MSSDKKTDSNDADNGLKPMQSVGQGEVEQLGDGEGSVKPVNPAREETGLKRDLAQRHLMMLAIGGVIGPGYFVGMGTGLSTAGPAGLLICFATVGALLWAVMQCLGELAAFLSTPGSFTDYTARFIDPAFGFALGWNYWFLWAGILMAEYNNLSLVLGFWQSAMPTWGWVLVFWFIFLSFTFLGVYTFGEAEFWLSAAKLLFIAAFFLCAILISSGAIGGEKIGFKFYKDPGAFADGAKGVFKIFVFAALQYSGTEMVGLTAGESANPVRDIPKAIRTVFYRILIIFVGGIFFLTITVPYNDPNLLSAGSKTARSPFVIAFTRVGATAGAHVVNAVILVTILSAVNGALYVGSRTLVGLAQQHQAPQLFRWTNARGVPVPALVVTNATGFLSLLNLSSGAGEIYTWIVSITGVSTFITWGAICACQIRLRRAMRAQGVPLEDLPFRAQWDGFTPWFGLGLSVFFIFFQGWTAFAPWDAETFVMNYVTIAIFITLAVSWKVLKKSKWARSESADLWTGRRC
ncbi:Amino acid permease [Lasiodiplodia theobromae]|uniref:Amino acid permease n=1 Tax=Lasiodiplodia theobromae TaxID=45133 RepID=UPI0015C32C05|nr:Amino acid permease [Lasiodiplodia theobromae]KAF4544027.1 Amino acid permease [Lasiodiplodia theobromae]